MGACHQGPNAISWPVPEMLISRMGQQAASGMSDGTGQACPLYRDALFMQLPADVVQRVCQDRLLQHQPQKGTHLAITYTMRRHAASSKNLPFDL